MEARAGGTARQPANPSPADFASPGVELTLTQDTKGPALNRRVAALFERAGFKTQPNSQSTAEFTVTLHGHKKKPLDLHASDSQLGITIIGSNKSGKIEPFTEHISDLKLLVFV